MELYFWQIKLERESVILLYDIKNRSSIIFKKNKKYGHFNGRILLLEFKTDGGDYLIDNLERN